MIFCRVIYLFLTLVSASSAQSISFEFDGTDNAINGNTTLGDTFKSFVDGTTNPGAFNLSSIVSGLTLTVTASQGDISNTNNGLGIGSGGTLDSPGDALTFTFNRAITFDFLDMGDFGPSVGDVVQLSYSNSNPTVTLGVGDFDNNTSDTITFSSANLVAANESFTLSYDGGAFSIEGFNVTVVPEPGIYAVLAGLCGMAFVMLKSRHA